MFVPLFYSNFWGRRNCHNVSSWLHNQHHLPFGLSTQGMCAYSCSHHRWNYKL